MATQIWQLEVMAYAGKMALASKMLWVFRFKTRYGWYGVCR